VIAEGDVDVSLVQIVRMVTRAINAIKMVGVRTVRL
jgi:hypothetical protein